VPESVFEFIEMTNVTSSLLLAAIVPGSVRTLDFYT